MKELLKKLMVEIGEDQRRTNLKDIYGNVGTSALINRGNNALKDHAIYRDIDILLESLGKKIVIVDK